jgi:hypothetical protein
VLPLALPLFKHHDIVFLSTISIWGLEKQVS